MNGLGSGTSSADLRHRLLLHLSTKAHQRSLQSGSEGFTLIELMIVIVIVAILMAIALPNFLNQTNKAKMTEARTLNNAALKEAQAAWIESGSAGMTAWAAAAPTGACPTSTKNWSYAGGCVSPATGSAATAAGSAPSAQITALGTTDSGDLSGKNIISAINLQTGRICTFTSTSTPTVPTTCVFS